MCLMGKCDITRGKQIIISAEVFHTQWKMEPLFEYTAIENITWKVQMRLLATIRLGCLCLNVLQVSVLIICPVLGATDSGRGRMIFPVDL